MTTKQLLISLLLCPLAFNISGSSAATLSHQTGQAEKQNTKSNGQSRAPLSLALDKGTVQVKTANVAALSGMKLRLRLSDGSSLAGDLELAGQDAGTDKAGAYERTRYRLNAGATTQPARKESVSAVLEMRHYLRPDVLIASLDYAGPSLAASDGVQLIMSLDGFARGMALKRLKLYWTAPVFVSDPRFLSPSNQLLLWKQVQADNYHLLVPLAGDGMIGEIGVAEIDYRYEFRVSSSSRDPNFSPHRIAPRCLSNSICGEQSIWTVALGKGLPGNLSLPRLVLLEYLLQRSDGRENTEERAFAARPAHSRRLHTR